MRIRGFMLISLVFCLLLSSCSVKETGNSKESAVTDTNQSISNTSITSTPIIDQASHIYGQAITAEQSGEYQKAIDLFSQISKYKDAASHMNSCTNYAKYESGINYMEIKEYRKALEVFISLGDFQNSKELAKKSYDEIIVASVYTPSNGLVAGNAALIDAKGNKITSIQYHYIDPAVTSGLIRAISVDDYNKINSYGYITKLGDFVHSQSSMCKDKPEIFEKLMAVYDKATKRWGYKETPYGPFVIKPQFINAYSFTEGRGAVQVYTNNDLFWGFIDASGKFRVPPSYDQVYSYTNGVARIGMKNVNPNYPELSYLGFIDIDGKVICKPTWTYLSAFNEGGAWFYDQIASDSKADGGYGWIDTSGKIVIQSHSQWWDTPSDFHNGHALVYVKNKGLASIDKSGHVALQNTNNAILSYLPDYNVKNSDFLITVKYSDRPNTPNSYGIVNQSGKTILEPKFLSTYIIKDSPMLIARKGYGASEYLMFSTNGKRITDKEYAQLHDFSEGYGAFSMSPESSFNGWGVINTKGNIVIQPKYQYITYFHNGIASAALNNRWGLLNINGSFTPVGEGLTYLGVPHNGFIAAVRCPDGSTSAEYWQAPGFYVNDGFVFKYGQQTCYLDMNGKVVIQDVGYDMIGDFMK